MSIRSTHTTRNLNSRKSSVPTVGKGVPLNARGEEGDISFRITPQGLKLYIKANGQWHGVKVGSSFDSLEKQINEIKVNVDSMQKFRLPSTYGVTGDFILDASGDIELNADGATVTFKDNTVTNYTFEGGLNPVMTMNSLSVGDSFSITLAGSGVATLATVDSSSDEGHLVLDADGDIHLDAVLSGVSDNIGLKNAGTIFGAFQVHHSASYFYLYENGGASTDDYLSFSVAEHGASTISTRDNAAAAADLSLVADGDITLDAHNDVILDARSGVIKFYANGDTDDLCALTVAANGATTIGTADSDGALGHLTLDVDGDITLDAASGNIYVKDNGGAYTPGSDYEIATKKYVDGTHKWHFNTGSRWYTRYDNWYFPSTTYGINSVNWSSSLNSAILPLAWNDAYNPCIVVPQDCKINSYHFYGNFTSSQTYQVALMTGTPSYGSAGNTTLSQIGATQELAATGSIYNKLEQTGFSASLSAGDIIIPCLRRTTADTSSYYYFEFAMNIVGTVS